MSIKLPTNNQEEISMDAKESTDKLVRSVLFVEGGLNTNCTVKSNLFGSSNFKIRNKLIAEYKLNKF